MNRSGLDAVRGRPALPEASVQPKSDRSQSYRLTQPWKVQPPYLLTISEAAARLGFTEGTLQRYCDRHLIGHITWRWKYGIIGRARRYIPKAALMEFLERRGDRSPRGKL